MGRKGLIIVESTQKATLFQKILKETHIVKSCGGHILELCKDRTLGVDIDNDFKLDYVVSKDKRKKLNDLISTSKGCDSVILASDGDREGEFIAWSLKRELKLKNPDRIVFHSMTKKAIDNALKKPKKIDIDMVRARDGRCALDRLIGFPISGQLQKIYGPGKSAGRCQSAVNRMVIDRENEVKKFFDDGAMSYYKVNGTFEDNLQASLYEKNKKDEDENDSDNEDTKKKKVNKKKIDLGGDTKEDIKNGDDDNDIFKGSMAKLGKNSKKNPPKEVKLFLENCLNSKFKVCAVFKKKSIRYPSAPFMTSTLLQDSYTKLGFSSKRTMSAAQSLYNDGYITYMRTDGVDMEEDAMKSIGKYIKKKYGDKYYSYKQYKTKIANSQEAHEAIRPTDITLKDVKEDLKSDELRLYKLIWKRTVASQMAPAEFEITVIQLSISKEDKYYFETSISKVIFDGFMSVYSSDKTDEKTNKFKPPKVGDKLKMETIVATQDYSKPKNRYTEATLNKKMLKMGIGRPATYASLIETVQTRGYAEKKDVAGVKKDGYTLTIKSGSNKIKEKSKSVTIGTDKNKLVPTESGIKVNDFLLKYFDNIIDYTFTAKMEKKLDQIAKGKDKWNEVVKTVYDELEPRLKTVKKKIDNGKFDKLNRKKLGKDPKSGKNVYAKFGSKNGSVYIDEDEDPKKCRRANLLKPLSFENVTLEAALKLLKYPKKLGKYKDEPVMLHQGDNGFYLKHKNANYSLEPSKWDNKKKSKEDSDDSDIDSDKDKKKPKKFNPKDFDIDKAIKIIKQKNDYLKEVKKSNLHVVKNDKHEFIVRESKLPDGQPKKGCYFIMVKNIPKKTTAITKRKPKFEKPVFIPLPDNCQYESLNIKDMEGLLKQLKEKKKSYTNSNNDDDKTTKKTDKKPYAKPFKKTFKKKLFKKFTKG